MKTLSKSAQDKTEHNAQPNSGEPEQRKQGQTATGLITPKPNHRRHRRPLIYSERIVGEFCQRIASGRSTSSVCSDADMPDESTAYKWLHKHRDFSQRLAQARYERVQAHAEAMIGLSEEVRAGTLDPQRAKVAIDGYAKAARLQTEKMGLESTRPNIGQKKSDEDGRSEREKFIARIAGIRARMRPADEGQTK